MDRMFISTALKYYKQRKVQEAIVRHAKNREISPRYGDGFGKRPDVLSYPMDVLEFAKRKATSFHCSEERWENPLEIRTGMSIREASELRIGWDLVLDIDAKDWEISKLTAWLFVKALQAHDIESISVKFSGNKGWHIGVPFEAFPKTITDADSNEMPMENLFPDMPRAVAAYLLDYIGNLITLDEDRITFGKQITGSISALAKKVGKESKELLENYCPACRKSVALNDQYILMCSCGFRSEKKYSYDQKASMDDKDRVCPKCRHIMDLHLVSKKSCPHDPKSFHKRFKITEVVEIDTILLASRHLYRMPYSLHEKSGLVSVVVDHEDILNFKKTDAEPDKISFDGTFLGEAKPGEANTLAVEAWNSHSTEKPRQKKEFEVPEEAIPEENFPPCMQKILSGLEDGKKRSMFALTNFLTVCGWSHDMIEERLYEWNKNNPEPLRETVVKGHIKHLKTKKERFPPPNCMQFYREIGVCAPDDLCRTIKNPAQYAVKKSKMKKR